MIQKYLSQSLDYKETNIPLKPMEKAYFVNAEGKILIYEVNGVKNIEFHNSNIRLNLVQVFLAFHSKNIEKVIEERKDNSFIFCRFKNDREILKASIKPRKYWKCLEIVNSNNFQQQYPFLYSYIEEFIPEENYINLLIYVSSNLLDEKELLYAETFKTNLTQLYRMVPIRQELYDGRIVYLSMMERELFLVPQIKTIFYLHENILEPLLIENEIRQSLIKQCLSFLSLEPGKIYILNFLNGDRDLLRAVYGMIKLQPEIHNIEYFVNEDYYDYLKSLYEEHKEKRTFISVSLFYKPNSKEIIARSIL